MLHEAQNAPFITRQITKKKTESIQYGNNSATIENGIMKNMKIST